MPDTDLLPKPPADDAEPPAAPRARARAPQQKRSITHRPLTEESRYILLDFEAVTYYLRFRKLWHARSCRLTEVARAMGGSFADHAAR